MLLILTNKDAMQYCVVEWDGVDVPTGTVFNKNGFKYKAIEVLRVFEDRVLVHVTILK